MKRLSKTEIAAGILILALIAWAVYVLVATERMV